MQCINKNIYIKMCSTNNSFGDLVCKLPTVDINDGHYTQNIKKICLLIKKMLQEFMNETNTELNNGKKNNIKKPELDKLFVNYRKDKQLKDNYDEYINYILKNITKYSHDKLVDNIMPIYNSVVQLMYLHLTTIGINSKKESNAKIYFSKRGINLVYSL